MFVILRYVKNRVIPVLAGLFFLHSPALQAADYLFFHADYSLVMHAPQGISDASFEKTGMHTVELTLDLIPLGKRLNDEGILPLPFLFPRISFLAVPGELLFPGGTPYSSYLPGIRPSGNPAMDRLIIELPLNYVKISRISTLGAKLYYEKTNYYTPVTFQQNKTYYSWGAAPELWNAGATAGMRSGMDLYAGLLNWNMGWLSAGLGYFYMDYRKPYSAILSGQTTSTAIVDSKLEVHGAIVKLSWEVPRDDALFWGVDVGLLAGGGSVSYSKGGITNDFLGTDLQPGMMQFSISGYFGMKVTNGMGLQIEAAYQDYIFKEKRQFSSVYIGNPAGAKDNTFMIQAGLFFYF